MFKNILVPTDGSALSGRAIKRAVQLAKEQKARVTGFYVGPAWSPKVDGDSILSGFISPEQHSAVVKKTADQYLGALKKAADAAGVPCKCLHAEGAYPYEKIVKAAQQNRCDLIVMASHGRRGISKLLLGSETAKVLAHSSVPVMVCR
jgi:nucleotide-binding universal stress UspA family protein